MDLERRIVRLLIDSGTPADFDRTELLEALKGSDADQRRTARGLLAALLLRGPNRPMIDEVRAFIEGIAPGDARNELSALFEGVAAFAPSALGSRSVADVCSGFEDVDLAISVLASRIGWAPGAVHAEDLLRQASRPMDERTRDRFSAEVVEPWLLQTRFERNEPEVRRLLALEESLKNDRRWRFTREMIRRRLEGVSAAPLCEGRENRLLVVQNLQIGQGDEILRAGTLIALLLARDPNAKLDVVTRRVYLYDHPRIVAHPIEDEERVRALLKQDFDGYAWFDEIYAPEVRFLSWVPAELAKKAASSDLVLEAATQNNHLVLRRATVDGVDLRPSLVGPRGVVDAYDSLQKLALLLDLPWLGEGGGAFSRPFVAAPSSEAARRLSRLRGTSKRPLAVVQPFGGASEIKGYTRGQKGELAAQLEALVDEGFQVLVLPTGTEWGSRRVIEDVFAACSPQARRRLAIAPDGACGGAPEGEADELTERSDLDPADRAMRLYKYFLASADLVVAVEGWAAHLATLLERPVRLVLWAGSFSADWYPRGATWVDRLSPEGPPHERDPVIDGDARRLVLSRPRRALLATALRGLCRPSAAKAEVFLQVFESPDPELRAIAFAASSPQLEEFEISAAVRRALRDPVARVRAAAAGALLAREDLLDEAAPSAATLRAHQAIAGQRWQEVRELGRDAMPALAAAVDGEADFIRREARRFLQILLRERSRARPETPPASA